MNPEASSGIKAWQWIVTAIVIIVLIVIGVMVFRGNDSAAPTDGTNTAQNGGIVGGLNRIVMSDQYPGNIVYISSVQFDKPGWVAIHKDNNGQPGAIIGYTYFDKGISPGRVNLSEATMEGGVYYAMLHADNGDKAFDATKDMPIKDANGSIIMKLFRASASVGAEIKG